MIKIKKTAFILQNSGIQLTILGQRGT